MPGKERKVPIFLDDWIAAFSGFKWFHHLMVSEGIHGMAGKMGEKTWKF